MSFIQSSSLSLQLSCALTVVCYSKTPLTILTNIINIKAHPPSWTALHKGRFLPIRNTLTRKLPRQHLYHIKPVELRLIDTERLPIDLPTTLRLATAENLDIALAQARVQEAKGESDAAKLNLLPTLSGSQLYRHTSGTLQGTFGSIERPTFDTVNPEGVLKLSLNPGQAMFDALAAHRTFQATTANAAQVTQDTLLTAAKQYFDLVKAQSRINIAEQAIAESKEFLRITEVLEKQGAGLKVEVYRAEAKLQSDTQRLLSAQNEFRQASINLALTLKKIRPKCYVISHR